MHTLYFLEVEASSLSSTLCAWEYASVYTFVHGGVWRDSELQNQVDPREDYHGR